MNTARKRIEIDNLVAPINFIVELKNKIDPKDKIQFFDFLLEIYLSNGFESMTKKDMDLLLYHYLYEYTCTKKTAKSERISALLGLTLRKNDVLRLESFRRYSLRIWRQDLKEEVINRARVEVKELIWDLESNKPLRFRLDIDDPVVRMYIVKCLREDRGSPKVTANGLILNSRDFIHVLCTFGDIDETEESAALSVKKLVKEKTNPELEAMINKETFVDEVKKIIKKAPEKAVYGVLKAFIAAGIKGYI